MTEPIEPQPLVRRAWAFYDPVTGQVLQFGFYTAAPDRVATALGAHVLEITHEQMNEAADDSYVMDGQLLAPPAAPSPLHAWSWASKTWELDSELADAQARRRRSQLLAACDWTQLPDVPAATAALWAPYRQALRDLTLQAGYPFTINWPLEPTA